MATWMERRQRRMKSPLYRYCGKIKNYATAQAALSKRGTRALWRSGNTRLVQLAGAVALQYHGTNLVLWSQDGTIRLHTNNWRTVSSKKRMNWFLPRSIQVYQKDFEWYVQVRGRTYFYSDGMTVNDGTGRVQGAMKCAA